MSKGVFIFLSVIAGAAGFAAGYYIARKNERDAAEEEISAMRDYYMSKLGEKKSEVKLKTPSNLPLASFVQRYKDVVVPYKESIEKNQEDEDMSEYDEYETDEKADDAGYAQQEERAAMREMEPKIIRADDFGEEPDFDMEELLYFQEEDSLRTEDEDEIEDREGLLGSTMQKFDFENNEEMDLWVRNFRLQTDYHIRKIL